MFNQFRLVSKLLSTWVTRKCLVDDRKATESVHLQKNDQRIWKRVMVATDVSEMEIIVSAANCMEKKEVQIKETDDKISQKKIS